MEPVPNSGPGKFIAKGLGVAAGVAASYAIREALVSADDAKAREPKEGSMLDEQEATLLAMAFPFSLAAGIGLGMQKRGPTTGLTNATTAVTAALLSTAAGAVVSYDKGNASNLITGIALTTGVTGAGILYGIRDETKLHRARYGALGLAGFAVGMALPHVAGSLKGAPDQLTRGIDNR